MLANLLIALALALLPGNVRAGNVQGIVVVPEDERPGRPTRYYLGPYRSGRDAGPRGGPLDVVVYLKGTTPSPGAAPDAAPARMLQQEGRFAPHVLPVLVGTRVEFPNLDDFYHNVFSVVAGDRFDLGRFGQGESAGQRFDKEGVVVVRCELHANMKAYILVLDTPYFTVPDSSGRFTLKDVPPGTYTARAWHPERGEKALPVSVPTRGAVEADFAF